MQSAPDTKEDVDFDADKVHIGIRHDSNAIGGGEGLGGVALPRRCNSDYFVLHGGRALAAIASSATPRRGSRPARFRALHVPLHGSEAAPAQWEEQ